MIENRLPLIIEKTANGYQVRPIPMGRDMVAVSDIHVFQELGASIPTRDSQKKGETLLDWLETHFGENNG